MNKLEPRLHLVRLVLASAAACGLVASAPPARASHVGEELQTDLALTAATNTLLGALRAWESAPAAAQPQRLDAVVRAAERRQALLLELLERNPRLASARLAAPGLRERLPAAARRAVEEDLVLTGTVFSRVSDDFARGLSRAEALFQASPSEPALRLHLADTAAAERAIGEWSGRTVRLAAARIDGHLVVRSNSDVQLVAADGTSSGASQVGSTPLRISGDQRTLVVLANFNDAMLACTATDVSGRVFAASGSSVNTAYLQSSRNLVGFSGQVVGPFTIPYSATGSCDYGGWGGALDSAAKAAGVDLTQYKRINYVTPRNANCGWTGLAYMPGTRSWVQSCSSTGVYSHELGHNLSLHHAATPSAEYGDGSDPMGGARNVRNNGANQATAGWIPAGGVLDVLGGGSYAVTALGPEAGSAVQVLRVAKPDTSETYFVSLRGANGLDAGLPSTALNAVSVHRGTGTLSTRTYLLQYLAAGQSFVDSVNGIEIANQGVAGAVATVAVAFGGGSCARSAPTLKLNPLATSGAPGAAASYAVSVGNTNSAACGSSTFSLSGVVPAGFSSSLASSSLTIAAGSSASTTWTVASGSATADGSYSLDLSTAEASAGAATTTAHATHTVLTDAAGPSLTITSPAPGATLSGSKATIRADASDPSGVAKVEFWVGGKLIATDTGAPYSASWNLRKQAKGSVTLTVRAFDTVGNVSSQSVSVTVN